MPIYPIYNLKQSSIMKVTSILPTVLISFTLLFSFCESEPKSKLNTEVETEITEDKKLTKVAFSDNSPSLENITTKTERFTVQSGNEVKKETSTGTTLEIPANTFVDANGRTIKGEVNVSFKEIRTAADILVENIDMRYDSAGVVYDFQTAGMFDIQASAGGEPVFIKEGKSIEVSYTSDKEGGYSFYNYKDDNWNYNQAPQISKDTKSKSKEESFKGLSSNSLKPTKANPSEDLIIDVKADYSSLAELKIYKNVIWKYVGKKDEDGVIKTLQKHLSKIKLQKTKLKGQYRLEFFTGKNAHNLLVAPVFTGKEFRMAMQTFNERQNSFIQNNTQITRRKVSVTQLGLMNYDRIYHRGDCLFVDAKFKIEGSDKELDLEKVKLFHITGDDDIVVRQYGTRKLNFVKIMSNKLVAILPGNKVAVMSSNNFNKETQSKAKGDKQTFVLTPQHTVIKTSTDLDAIIASL